MELPVGAGDSAAATSGPEAFDPSSLVACQKLARYEVPEESAG